MNNGGCWSETKNGKTFSACSVQFPSTSPFLLLPFLFYIHPTNVLLLIILQDSEVTGCKCPQGFQGDGHKCEGMREKPRVEGKVLL